MTHAAIVCAVLATVAFLPGAMDRWTFPKLTLAAIAALLAAFGPSTGRIPRSIAVLIAVACSVLAAAAVLGGSPLAQFLGRWPRYEGAVSISVYIAMIWAGARLLGPLVHRRALDTFYEALSWATVAIAALATCEALGWDPLPSDLTRPGSLLGNASDEGSVALMAAVVLGVPVFLSSSMEPDQRPRRIGLIRLGLGAAIVSVILSASRTAEAILLLVVLAGITIAVVRGVRTRGSFRAAIATGVVLLLTVALAFAVPLTRDRLVGAAPNAQSLTAGRGVIWGAAMNLVAQHPLLGVGPNGFVDAFPGYQTVDVVKATGVGVTVDSPHNAELQVLAAGGVLLAAVAVALAVLVVVHAGRALTAMPPMGGSNVFRWGAAVSLVAYVLTLQTTFTAPANAILPMFLLGAVVAAPPGEDAQPPGPGRGRSIGMRVGFGALTVVLLAASAAEIPLQNALVAAGGGDLPRTLAAYDAARALRPWDGDVTVIEAQTLTQLASNRVGGAAAAAVAVSQSAVRTFPHSVLALKALSAALEFEGRESDALRAASTLNRLAPHDPEVAARIREIRHVMNQQ